MFLQNGIKMSSDDKIIFKAVIDCINGFLNETETVDKDPNHKSGELLGAIIDSFNSAIFDIRIEAIDAKMNDEDEKSKYFYKIIQIYELIKLKLYQDFFSNIPQVEFDDEKSAIINSLQDSLKYAQETASNEQ